MWLLRASEIAAEERLESPAYPDENGVSWRLMAVSTLPVEDPIVIFAIVACLILVIPFVMAKLKMPALVGLLLAGAIFGPNALHVLDRDQSFILLGKVGLMFIMFIAALEVDLGVFKKFGLHAAVFGVLTFAIPLAAAAPVAFY